MDTAPKPHVLFVYYTFTKQALKITEAMESVFHAQGWESTRASIEFVDARYKDRFKVFPLEHRYLDQRATDAFSPIPRGSPGNDGQPSAS